jgi:hypothetical protein
MLARVLMTLTPTQVLAIWLVMVTLAQFDKLSISIARKAANLLQPRQLLLRPKRLWQGLQQSPDTPLLMLRRTWQTCQQWLGMPAASAAVP